MAIQSHYAGFIINVFSDHRKKRGTEFGKPIKVSSEQNFIRCGHVPKSERMNVGRNKRSILNLSSLFPLSFVTGLMPCAVDDVTNRWLTTYTIVSHVIYRITNLTVLIHYLLSTDTSVTLWSLITLVAVMKCLCTTVHVTIVIRKRLLLLKLTSDCDKSHFYKNTHRRLTKIIIAYEIYLYTAGQIIQRRWLSALRDVFSSIDVLCPIFIILQYCTFLEIATNRFDRTRVRLVLNVHRAEEILDQHIKNLRFVEGLQEMYTLQMFFCVCYLGLDFFVASFDTMESILTGKRLEWLICTVSYSLLCLSTVFILCRACEITKLKTEKFNWELHNLMNRNTSLCSNDVLRIYLRIVKPLTFTGNRFFNIGYPLITSIIAAATTYLIFLTQFSI